MRSPIRRILSAGLLLALSVARVGAHHAAAPHYDQSKRVEVAGTIERFEPRNPHSFIFVKADNGTVHKCEFNAIANLTRVGISAATFPVGQRITVTANPHRRVAEEWA